MSAHSTRTLLERWSAVLMVVPLTMLFDHLFWGMEPGLNLTLFALVAMSVGLFRHGWRRVSVPARWAYAGTLLAAAMVWWHHSTVAIVAVVMGLIVFAGSVHEPALRSVPFAIPQAALAFFMAPTAGLRGVSGLRGANTTGGSGWRWVRIAVLPVLVAMAFVQLYRVGNPRFDVLTAGLFDGLFDLLGELLTPHLLFLVFAMMVCAALVRRIAPDAMHRIEHQMTDTLVRTRIRRPRWMRPLSMDPLERERRAGVVLLVLVNIALMVVNVIDISWVWLGFTVPKDFSLKQFVHEGTWALIWSIMLSMLVLLYLFRRNLNFHPRNTPLKHLATVWVVQNFILGISVFLRNYHYISFHGLAYKRVGVIVFLALVLIGLITLYIKVRERRSFYYLTRVNAWAWFAVLIGLTTVDWDSTIVRYNLAHDNPGEIDIDNYLAMSDKVLPLLYANLDQVELQMARHRNNRVRWVEHLDPAEFRSELDAKRDRFMQRVEGQRWQESNAADARTLAALKTMTSASRR
jgi:hypothetical protein